MKIKFVIVAVLLALVACSNAEEINAAQATGEENQDGSVSHAKLEQPAQVAPGARHTPKNRPSELDRLLREGAQEKGQGLGRLDRKRGE
jgi:hypothetical protein